MSLADRLHDPTHTPIHYGRWQWKHITLASPQVGYATLIDEVLDRYARRFGVISNADQLQLRLAKKYSRHPSATLRALGYGQLNNVYPLSFRRAQVELRIKAEAIAMVAQRLKWTWENAEKLGAYSRYPSYCSCAVCEVPLYRSGIETNHSNPDLAVRVNGKLTCRDKRCRALAAYTGKNVKLTGSKLITKTLKELSKHDNENDTHKRGLAKHFIRHS